MYKNVNYSAPLDKNNHALTTFATPKPNHTFKMTAGATAITIEEEGDASNQLSAWILDGVTEKFSDNGKLYWGLTQSGGDNTVTLYSDSGGASADEVATGTRTGDGSITLAASNSSGITGSVTVAYSGDDGVAAANILRVPLIHYRPFMLFAETETIYIKLGDKDVVATAEDMSIPAGIWLGPFMARDYSHISCLRSSSGGTLHVQVME